MRPGQFSDGAWDCSHAYEPRDHYDAWCALGRPTDPEAAINVVRAVWGDDSEARDAWLAQYADDVRADSRDTVDLVDEYACWRDAWQARAVDYTRGYMRRWTADVAE